jgi:hypothetical protein
MTGSAGCDTTGARRDETALPAPDPTIGPFPTGPVDTSTLLPYGTRYSLDSGEVATLTRVAGPVLEARGEVAFCDPGFFRYEQVWAVASFTGSVACELGVVEFPAVGDGRPVRRVATVAFGDVVAVDRWDDVVGPTGERHGFGVDAGTGALYDVAAKPALDGLEEDRIGPLFMRVMDDCVAVVEVDGRTAAVMFDCGVGDGWYPVYAGHDAGGRVVAVATDLELHHHLARLEP